MISRTSYRQFQRILTPPSRRWLSHFRVVDHVVPASYVRTYPGAIEPGADNHLRLAVKQYIPVTQLATRTETRPLTIIGAHANGFPKELYEPLWDDLYEALRVRGQAVQSIWIADIVNQGQSGRINESILGNDPNWWDHARDLLFFINGKQEQMTQPLIGIGHSMGASILTALALLHPSLFQSLVLIEPVIQVENPSKSFAPPSTHRRDQWPTKEAATEAFTKSKFYQAWDSRVLHQWLQHGLTTKIENNKPPKSDSGVPESSVCPESLAPYERSDEEPPRRTQHQPTPFVLSTTKAQEVFHYLRPLYKGASVSGRLRSSIYPDVDRTTLEDDYDFYRPEPVEIFHQLPKLRPSVLYCFGKSSPVSTPDLRQQKMRTTGTAPGGSGGVSEARVKEIALDTGHMIPFEKVDLCASIIAEWIDEEMVRWQANHDEWQQIWGNTEDKRSIGEEWLKRMPKPEKPPNSKR